MIVISGGTLMTTEGPIEADLRIENGLITEISPVVGNSAEVTIDASGCFVGPGFVDLHVHFRDPGQTWKEDLTTGSQAAAAGGYTAAVAMPNTDPAIDLPDAVADVSNRGSEVGLLEVAVAGALTRDRGGVVATDVRALYGAGVRLFTDDGDAVEDVFLLRDQMLRLSHLPGAVVSQHAEDKTQTRDGHLHDGEVSKSHQIGGLPSSAETDVVARDLQLTEETHCPYHCQHVSAAATVEVVRRAKSKGLMVTAEVTPHHLYFTEEDLSDLDTNLKMYPPLRSAADRSVLIEALRNGTIDVVATDHAPHTQAEKDLPFEDAPRGVIGLETAASVAWGVLEEPTRFFDVMSVKPAEIAGMAQQGLWLDVGMPANLVVFDPNKTWEPEHFASRSGNSPFVGEKLTGRVRATVFWGKLTYQLDGQDE